MNGQRPDSTWESIKELAGGNERERKLMLSIARDHVGDDFVQEVVKAALIARGRFVQGPEVYDKGEYRMLRHVERALDNIYERMVLLDDPEYDYELDRAEDLAELRHEENLNSI